MTKHTDNRHADYLHACFYRAHILLSGYREIFKTVLMKRTITQLVYNDI